MNTSNSSPILPDDFPTTGMVNLLELSTYDGKRGFFPQSPDTWQRRVETGEYPAGVKLGRVRYWHAELVRAISAGRDWRLVQIAMPEMANG